VQDPEGPAAGVVRDVKGEKSMRGAAVKAAAAWRGRKPWRAETQESNAQRVGLNNQRDVADSHAEQNLEVEGATLADQSAGGNGTCLHGLGFVTELVNAEVRNNGTKGTASETAYGCMRGTRL
jgi:hypothetical protein